MVLFGRAKRIYINTNIPTTIALDPLFVLFQKRIYSGFGQTDSITVNNNLFIITTSVVANEWKTYDTLNQLYRIENEQTFQVLKYYSFKDEGSDCNNSFWDVEKLETTANQFIFTTFYYQKTGIDPIPEKRLQIYEVQADGKLILVFNKYQFHSTNEWTDL